MNDIQFPCDAKDTIIQVLYQKGDPAFICGVNGRMCVHMMEEIEKEMNEDEEVCFEDGNGEYLFSIQYVSADYDEYGRMENRAYWDLTKIAFQKLNYE